MTRIRYFSKYFPLLFLLAFVIAVMGCSSHESPLEPASDLSAMNAGDPIPSPNFVVINKASKGDNPIQMTTSVEQLVIAADGGVVTNGRVSLNFPPGALAVDTSIRIDMDTSGLLISDMRPHGSVFLADVILTMNLVGTSAENDAANTYVAWYNEVTEEWEMIENLPPPDANTIQGKLRHFSKYSGVGG